MTTEQIETPLKRLPYQEHHAKIALALEVSLSFVWAMVESGFPEFGASIEDAQRWLKQNPNFCGSKWVEHPSGGRARIEYLGGAR